MKTTGRIDSVGLDMVPFAAWSALAQRRIYFGHQSVGYNLLDGVAGILAERPAIGLNVVESGDPGALESPALVHSRIGTNTDPLSKAQAFSNYMLAGGGERAELAFFKLCYADIGHQTDVPRAFEGYERTMTSLQERFPKVKFLHMTVPLSALPRGLKQTVKKAVGRPLWGYEHNRRREQFNDRMRKRYGSSGRLFDIAALESKRPDGTCETFSWGGASYPVMYPGYTVDSGHLGDLGRRVIGTEFLVWLAEAAA